jgi:outer membrane lipoprotein-sorting protein
VPKALADRVSEVILEITPENRIARIIIQQVDTSVTEFRLHQQKENVEISNQEFHFAPPAGVEVVEGIYGP